MYALKAMGPRDLRLVEMPDPAPGTGDVVVAVRACGICGSDKWIWSVTGPADGVAGHEVAGDVIGTGAGVTSLRVGDRVAVNNVRGCGICPACRAGAFVRCPTGITHMSHGFAERVAVPARNCLPLADDIGYEAGSLIFDTWGTPYAALERAGVTAGDTVLVLGCGPIGLGAVVLAGTLGAQVIAVDGLGYRRDAAMLLGAVAALAPDDTASALVSELTGGTGVDTALECSGNPAAYDLALAALRIGGTLVALGEGAVVELHPSRALIPRHLNLLGSLYSTMPQGERVQELIVAGRIDPTGFVTHRFGLAELPAAFESVVACRDGLLKSLMVASG